MGIVTEAFASLSSFASQANGTSQLPPVRVSPVSARYGDFDGQWDRNRSPPGEGPCWGAQGRCWGKHGRSRLREPLFFSVYP